MSLKVDLVEPFNDQIRSEFTASSQYIAIAAYFEEMGLLELAKYFFRQSDEERMHAMKFIDFMLETGVRPTIPGTPELKNEFDSPANAVAFALAQEQSVTEQINNLVNISINVADHAANNFLQWFVTEQVEEEDSMGQLLQTIKLAGDNLLLVEEYVRRNPQHAEEEEEF